MKNKINSITDIKGIEALSDVYKVNAYIDKMIKSNTFTGLFSISINKNEICGEIVYGSIKLKTVDSPEISLKVSIESSLADLLLGTDSIKLMFSDIGNGKAAFSVMSLKEFLKADRDSDTFMDTFKTRFLRAVESAIECIEDIS